MKIVKKYAVLIVCVFLILFFLQKINWLPSFKNIFRSNPVVIENTPAIITNINALSQLLTLTYTDEIVMDTVKAGNGLPSFWSSSIGMVLTPAMDHLVIIGRGKIIAGSDLKNLSAKNFSTTEDSIHVSLPHSQILQAIVNPSGFEVFAEEGNWSEEAVISLKQKIRDRLIKNALSQNILQQADERCKNLIIAFLNNTGYQKTSISFY